MTLYSVSLPRWSLLSEEICQFTRKISIKSLILYSIMNVFAWALASTSWQEEDSIVLLRMIVEHWVILRGFSNAKSLLEKYKRKSHQGVQKS